MPERIVVSSVDQQGYAECLEQIKPALKAPLHFLNAPFYGEWQEIAGKKVAYFRVSDGKEAIGGGMVIPYVLPGGFYYLYCPYGPVLTKWSPAVTDSIKKYFKDNFTDKKLLFVRLDADGLPPGSLHVPSDAATATSSLQPRNEWVLDISDANDKLLAGMHKKARYHINLAERSGATFRVEPFSAKQLDIFFDLMTTTSARDNFHILPKSYYQAIFETLKDNKNAQLAYVDIDGQPAAANLCVAFDGQAHYIFGCSANEFRRIAPSYFLQWKSIQRFKEMGNVQLYNFGGVSDDIKSTHLAGVTKFKQRFSGYNVSHDKPADIIMAPFGYKLFSLYKRLQHLR